MSKVNEDFGVLSGTVEGLAQEQIQQGAWLGLLEVQSAEQVDFAVAVLKEKMLVAHKLERLENQSRRNNLRFLNFPKSPIVAPVDMLHRYLVEVLNICVESFPPVVHA